MAISGDDSSDRFRATFEKAAVGIAHVSLDGHWLEFNQRLCEITGYERHELLEMTFQDITHPDDLDVDLAYAEELSKNRISDYKMEKRYLRKDGSIVWVMLAGSLVHDEHGQPDFFVAVVQDISERKHLEEAQSLLAAIVADSDDAIFSKTLDGTFLSWNAAAERIFGYTRDEAIGQSIEMITPPELYDEVRSFSRRLSLGEGIDDFETIRVSKAGRAIDVSLTISPLRNARDQIIGASTIARDITQRKKAQKTIQKSMQRKDEFIAMLSHELRNPLAAIRSGVELLIHGGGTETILDKATAVLDRQSAHMVKLLDDLLDVSRVTRDKLHLEMAPVDLKELLEEVVTDAAIKLADSTIELQKDIQEQPIPINGAASRLRQIFDNLIDNAIKFNKPGGVVSVSARSEGNEAVVRISDTGVGFPAEEEDLLFEAFQQGRQDCARSKGGMGLGLALTKGLVELHGGSIEAHSKGLDKGAEFVVRLPRISATTSPDQATSPADGASMNVLLVEDNADVAEMIRQMLQFAGHRVELAATGQQAIASATEYEFDIILCDLGLPGLMSGLDVARALRSDPQTRDIPLAALTGYGAEEDKRQTRRAGFDLHLTKPIDFPTLIEALTDLAGA